MAFPYHAGGGGPSSFPMSFQQPQSRASPQPSPSGAQPPRGGFGSDFNYPSPMLGLQDDQFDLFEWFPRFQSCLRYFLDHAQYSGPVQAVAAFVNIQLPHQRAHSPVLSSRSGGSPSAVPSPSVRSTGALPLPTTSNSVATLTPYIRRLVATGFDYPGVLHGFFGDDWAAGIGHLHEIERRNYLFAAKSGSWLDVKRHYDMEGGQTTPFLRPLQNVSEREIVSAESNWSEWLAMQDWMIGPRSIEHDDERNLGVDLKQESPDESHRHYHEVG
ncbi:hypothetical protein JX265_012713 [Neoarthrinium moseri]|uniref:Ilp is an apoptosis inhibitor n=1 Tax=Neoarthrinium moseri TaxID=1658444 RepID=A0A9P9WA56_9PEZI|nr:uncharacterized protein JN550_008871 [Neoarthrinium moseri]KAI1849464.1 hypothetical protein JX266_004959 [Neoarthrinium moseri]KAI1853422.1 hypothetical protein JX265_012713 [Neoarthrinium moseri]KAI1864584.1 hypothetical protein JN550_008871 [Neoarthrinium moseri]